MAHLLPICGSLDPTFSKNGRVYFRVVLYGKWGFEYFFQGFFFFFLSRKAKLSEINPKPGFLWLIFSLSVVLSIRLFPKTVGFIFVLCHINYKSFVKISSKLRLVSRDFKLILTLQIRDQEPLKNMTPLLQNPFWSCTCHNSRYFILKYREKSHPEVPESISIYLYWKNSRESIHGSYNFTEILKKNYQNTCES